MFLNDDGYIYIFYVNGNNAGPQCTSISRALAALPQTQSVWENWYGGNWVQALPPGYWAPLTSSFYYTAGVPADCWDSDPNRPAVVWFWVAAISGTGYYIAAEESSPEYTTWQMGVRFSTDLLNWTDVQVLATAPTAWGDGQFTYPVIYDEWGTTNSAIDPTTYFWIVGNQPSNGYQLSAMKLSIDMSEAVPIAKKATRETTEASPSGPRGMKQPMHIHTRMQGLAK